MESSAATADAGAVVLRTTFFVYDDDYFGPERAENLHEVSDAIDTLARFLDAAFMLADWDEPIGATGLTAYQRRDRARKQVERVEIVSISMNSPLEVVLKIPADVIGHVAGAAISIGERICTFPSRVSAGRAQHKLEAELAKAETELAKRAKQLAMEGRADVAAQELLAGMSGRRGVRPAYMDYIDADAKGKPQLVQIQLPGTKQ